ncbi:foldase protein PrsA [Paenibacillus pini]|uniref:Foldase protein PrsA n=1 Tax=Paenibacillus pini JCM 16418 TaxID=1236976 RepID=W7YWE2_9BACL|nr:peptidylprolyl isomerase [Paenibacillus pini]GAF06644.1 foldase protein PrsA precursor [Paenibacillus pini JCM 16418]
MTDREREPFNNGEAPNENETTGDNVVQQDITPESTPLVTEERNEPAAVNLDKDRAANPMNPVPTPASPGSPSGSSKIWMIVSLVLAVVLVIVLIKPPFAGSSKNETVATVNDVKITKDKLYDALVDAGGAQTLDTLITEELVNQAATEKKITVTDADIAKEIETIKKGFNSETEYQQALTQSNMTEDDLKKQMDMQVKIRKLVEPTVKVTDDEVKKYFDENKESLNTPEQVKASHILVATKAEAEAILKELKGGADFATVAKEKSTDPGSKANGGDLGYFGKGVMNAPFEKAAFALEPGKLSDVVQSENGFHIIKVTDHKKAVEATFEGKKAEIKEKLITQAINTAAPTWLADIKAKAKITNSLEEKAAADAKDKTTDKTTETDTKK